MALIIAMITRKGGSGKTTLTRLLAGEFAFRDMSCHLIDADDQGTLRNWVERLKANKTCPPQISISEVVMRGNREESKDSLLNQVEANNTKDVILIDSVGVASEVGILASRLADMVLVPTKPFLDDTDSAIATAKAIFRAVPKGEKPPLLRFVLNEMPDAIKGSSKAILDAATALSDLGFVVLQTPITNRKYIMEMNAGYGTLYTMPEQQREYLKRTKAEIESVVDRIERIITTGFDEDELPSEDPPQEETKKAQGALIEGGN